MVIQHNLQAMNANRMLNITTQNVSDSTEKLSSGYKINRAADDAAGLAISEKMRKQIRGLDRASTNAEDGISCVQTAEGAMAEVTDMLQRMNELCVQAANGTNSESDRQYIQDEIDQLISEIDRVSETTKFNETYLLKGDEDKVIKKAYCTTYSVTYMKNGGLGVNELPYHIRYTDNNNIYMVSNDVFTSDTSTPISADKISQGDDITKYMLHSDYEPSIAHAVINADKYAAFINVELNTAVATGNSGKVHNEVNVTSDYDLSTNGIDNTVRANKDLFVYNTADSTVTRVPMGEEMTPYLNNDNTMKDGYRLVDILCGGTDATIGTSNATPIITYTGADADVYYWDSTSNSTILTHLTYGQNINDIYKIDNTINRYYNGIWGWTKSPKSIDDIITISADGNTCKFSEPVNMFVVNDYMNRPRNIILSQMNFEMNLDYCYTGRGQLNGYPYCKLGSGTGEWYVFFELFKNLFPSGDAFLVEPAQIDISYKTGTSDRVKNTILNGADFHWTEHNIEIIQEKSQLYDADGNPVSEIGLNKYFDENGNYKGGLFSSPQATATDEVKNTGDNSIELYINQMYHEYFDELGINLHVGADSDRPNKIPLSIQSLSSAALGIDKLHSINIGIVDNTGSNATDAIDVIADALKILSSQRANLGAIQNRLEHTIKNLDNVVENTTSAESEIRDTDMAEEMVRYTNNNVLQQAGQAMLAQANQSNQGILNLLQ